MWKMDITGFCDGGYIEGWNIIGEEGANELGALTSKFFSALSRQSTSKE
jgi:hypothetical protein